MAREQAAAQGAPAVDEAALAEMRRLIFDAPIQELADSQGISIDDAVKLRVEKSLEAAPLPIEVSVRPIEPMGKLLGYASINIGGVVVDDFKVVDGKNGIFLSAPSKEAPGTRAATAPQRGDEPVLAGAVGQSDRGGIPPGGGASGGPRRGCPARPHPGADGKGGTGGGQGQRRPARPSPWEGDQG